MDEAFKRVRESLDATPTTKVENRVEVRIVKQVIQGSHMVSGTRCPAWRDWLKKWSESRAAASKG